MHSRRCTCAIGSLMTVDGFSKSSMGSPRFMSMSPLMISNCGLSSMAWMASSVPSMCRSGTIVPHNKACVTELQSINFVTSPTCRYSSQHEPHTKFTESDVIHFNTSWHHERLQCQRALISNSPKINILRTSRVYNSS